jgi:hypothetical protein
VRLRDFLRHPLAHAALTNVSTDQHHVRPGNLEVANTTLTVYPLPGGPDEWDIVIPYAAQAVLFSFRSSNTTAEGGGKAGVVGIATRNQFDASTCSTGGHGTISSSSYNAVYTKRASALNLSHKVFASTGADVSLTEAYLYETVPGTTRVFRTVWTNYSAGLRTLNCWGEVAILY